MSGNVRSLSSVATSRLHLRALAPLVVPVVCAVFVALAAFALTNAPVNPGVQVDSRNVVVSVDPGSDAWTMGVRPGWVLAAVETGRTLYESQGRVRPVLDDPHEIPLLPTFTPALVALLASALALLIRSNRLAASLGVLGAALAAATLGRFGPGGAAAACVPVALAVGVGWQLRPLDAAGDHRRPAMAFVVGAAIVALLAALGDAVAERTVTPVVIVTLLYLAAGWALAVMAILLDARAAGRSFSGAARDVALELVPFAGRLRQRAAQAERERLASDLHAEVLPAIASTAAALEQEGAHDAATRLRDLAAGVRELVSERRLPILEQQGLVAAAEWLAESLENRSDLRIEIDLAGRTDERQPLDVERVAYRILQLSLDNVIRHAHATTATVVIAGNRNSLTLSVADDGRGIRADAAERAARGGHLGLADMRAEAAAIGGAVTIGRGAQIGTVVKLRWRA